MGGVGWGGVVVRFVFFIYTVSYTAQISLYFRKFSAKDSLKCCYEAL